MLFDAAVPHQARLHKSTRFQSYFSSFTTQGLTNKLSSYQGLIDTVDVEHFKHDHHQRRQHSSSYGLNRGRNIDPCFALSLNCRSRIDFTVVLLGPSHSTVNNERNTNLFPAGPSCCVLCQLWNVDKSTIDTIENNPL